LGALEAGEVWCIPVLLASSVLNAAYFLPIVYDAWFSAPRIVFRERVDPTEVQLTLLLPTLATALLSVAAGVLAGASRSPLGWAKLIASRELRP
jgi:multicomponent Na+:H+ antiporter subunit D